MDEAGDSLTFHPKRRKEVEGRGAFVGHLMVLSVATVHGNEWYDNS
jgi:hypothetical protein